MRRKEFPPMVSIWPCEYIHMPLCICVYVGTNIYANIEQRMRPNLGERIGIPVNVWRDFY